MEKEVKNEYYLFCVYLLLFLVVCCEIGDGLCKPDQFRCNNGQCVSSLWDRCDFILDCADGSDEVDCGRKCNVIYRMYSNKCPLSNGSVTHNSGLGQR